jgi:hypothetical protein
LINDIIRMKNIKTLTLLFLGIVAIVQFSGCGGGTTVKPKALSEVLKAVFYAQQVKHDNVVVYTKGGASNTVDNYKKLKFDLSSGSTVSFTDFDGNTFTGNYSISADNKSLTLSGLTPVPTGSGGTVTFSVVSFTESPAQVVLSRVGQSVKTGNTTNEYTLTTTP